MNDSLLVDTHVHSDNSPDGNHSCMFICENAVSMGLKAIAITDHCDERSVMQSYFEVLKARDAYRGKLVVLRGIELGEPTYDLPLAEKILSRFEYDVVIASIHNLRAEPDFYYLKDVTPARADALMREYLHELLLLADWGGFDVLAHLTYPLRYFYAHHGIEIDMNDYKKEVDALLSRKRSWRSRSTPRGSKSRSGRSPPTPGS